MTPRVMLISTPWASVRYPSIQLGTLKAVLNREGLACSALSLAVHWLEYIQRHSDLPRRLSALEYERVARAGSWWGLADWVFALPPVRSSSETRDNDLLAFAAQRGASADLIASLKLTRNLAAQFLDEWADRIVSSAPALVGFSTTYCQNQASLGLAYRIKQRSPSTTVVFGGANCEGTMGKALQRFFPWVDVAVSGAGEQALLSIVRELVAGQMPTTESARTVAQPFVRADRLASASILAQINALPIPDYDEYFEAIEATVFYEDVAPWITIPFESARGCWWGAKHHCTFCGLNGESMAFASKPPQRMVDEIKSLSSKYQCRRLEAVDNIIDTKYFASVLPELKRTQLDFDIFYEVKANLTKSQICLLKESGVERIQPGIESLSTPILRIMKKGVSALQNIRLLKWCSEFGLRVTWNIIYGFPLEPPEEYRRMSSLATTLFHLEPPRFVPLAVHRFSPYYFDAEALGIKLTGPDPTYRFLYDLDVDSLSEIAYAFSYEHRDGRNPELYANELRDVIIRWQAAYTGPGALMYYVGPDYVEIIDKRRTRSAQYICDRLEGAIYLACDDGRTVASLVSDHTLTKLGVTERACRSFLDQMVSLGLMYEEKQSYLSLAVGSSRARTIGLKHFESIDSSGPTEPVRHWSDDSLGRHSASNYFVRLTNSREDRE